MKNTILFAFAAFALSGCRTVSPDAGHEAVLIAKPLIFGHGGIDSEPVKTGLSITALTTESIYVNMQPMQFTEHFDDLMSSDGVPLDFDSVLRLQITSSVDLIRNFGDKWYDNNVKAEYRNRVRQAVRKHGMNETAINTQAVDAIDKIAGFASNTAGSSSGTRTVKRSAARAGMMGPPRRRPVVR